MDHETADRSAETPPRGGPAGSGQEHGPALRARAAFLENWGWESVVRINRGACERGRAQHGPNPETQAACATRWEAVRFRELSLLETFDLLRRFHQLAPFLFFNGNTFATIGRELAAVLFSDLPQLRRRTVASAVAHYIAGVLDRDSMIGAVEELSTAADLQPGDRVKTLRGSSSGTIVRLLPDGRVVWRTDDSQAELTSLPEGLVRESKPRRQPKHHA